MARIKDLTRMCKETKCKDCSLNSGGDVNDCWVYTFPDSYPDEGIDAIIDKWVSEHPVKTYAMDFFEKFPNAKTSEKGIPVTRGFNVCRKELYSDELPCIWTCGGYTKCWNREMKEK